MQARLGELEEAAKILKHEFVGLDSNIDCILDVMRPWYLVPGALQCPIVIGLWGRTGTGKTSLILRLAEILKWGNRFAVEDLGKFTGSQRVGGSDDLGIFDKCSALSGQPCVFLFDEIQAARTRSVAGEDLDRPNLRDFWGFLDQGKVPRDYRPMESILFSFADRLRFLQSSPGPQNPLELGQWDIELVRRYLGIPGESLDLIDSWSQDARKFYQWAVMHLRQQVSNRVVADFSHSLVFIAGNLDAAFVGSDLVDPGWATPDDLYEISAKLTVNDVKRALLKLFRPEQVGRLGSTHVIFHGFNAAQYRKLIDRKLTECADRAAKTLELDLRFEPSVHQMLYEEAAIPAQGARPVISLIGEYIESQLPNWVAGARLAGAWRVPLRVSYENKVLKVRAADGKTLPPEFFESTPRVSQAVIRRTPHEAVKREFVAVHEAGHAVVGTALYGMLPKQVNATGFDPQSGGHVDFGDFPVLTRELGLQQIAVLIAGKAAEDQVFGGHALSSGSASDLRNATFLATQMIAQFGMDSHVGLSSADFPDNLTTLKSADDRTKERWLKAALTKARRALASQSEFFREITAHLINHPAVTRDDLRRLLLAHYRAPKKAKEEIIRRERPMVYEGYVRSVRRFLSKSRSKI